MKGEIQSNSAKIVGLIPPLSSFLKPHPRVSLIERKQAPIQLGMKLRELPRLLEKALRAVGKQLGAILGCFFVQKHVVAARYFVPQFSQLAIENVDPVLSGFIGR